MVHATASGCINHPGIEAVARCKQCGRPVCGACVVVVGSGRFCSDDCKDKYVRFVQRAQELDRTSRRAGDLAKLKRFVIKLAIFLVAIGGLGVAAVYLKIPVASDLVHKIVGMASPYVPFLH